MNRLIQPQDAVASPSDHPWELRLGVVWRAIQQLGVVIALSLVWLVALGLILPLPAVTAAILRVALARARGRDPNLLPEFVLGLRDGWLRATALGALSAVVTVVLIVDLWFLAGQSSDLAVLFRSTTVLLLAWWALVSVHLWALVGGTGMPLPATIRAAIGLSVVELPSTAAAIGVAAAALILLAAWPPALVLAGPGVVATIWAKLAWRAMGRHLAPDVMPA
jgi:uncharacterized membrane protein YesL